MTYPVTVELWSDNKLGGVLRHKGAFREMGARTDAEVYVWASDADEILAGNGECTAYINSPPTEGSTIQISPESDRARQERIHSIWRPARLGRSGKTLSVTIE